MIDFYYAYIKINTYIKYFELVLSLLVLASTYYWNSYIIKIIVVNTCNFLNQYPSWWHKFV